MWRGKGAECGEAACCCRETAETGAMSLSLAAAASTRWFDGVGEKKELASEARAPEVPGEHLLTKSRLAAR
jgi:hypothetical protein